MQRKRIGRDGAERLASIDGFGDLSLAARRELARLADEVTAGAGETLMTQGERGFEFLMLEQGTAEVIMDGERINVLGPGDFFGELALLHDGIPRTASVVASTDIRAIGLSAHFLREARQRMPSVGAEIDRVAAERIERDRRAAS